MSKAKPRFLDKRLIGLIAALGLTTPLIAQDAEKVADDAIGQKLETVDPEKVKNIEIILKQQYELEGDTFVMEANELIKHKRYEAASEKFDAAKNRYEKVSKSEPSILKKIAEVDKLHAQTLRLLADKLVKEAIENADENSATAFDKALTKLNEAKELDPSRTVEIDSEIKTVNKKVAVFEHDEKVGRSELKKKFKYDPREGSIANGILFSKAKIYYQDRRFMEAKGMVERILMNQPYNKEAVNLLYRINKKIHLYGKERRNMIRQEYIDEVLWKWSDPIVAYSNDNVIKAETETVDEDKTLGGIYKKLQIVIPKVRFDKRKLDFVVTWIKRKTRELDEEGEGLNIIVSVDDEQAGAAPDAGAGPADPFGAGADAGAADPFAAEQPAADPFGGGAPAADPFGGGDAGDADPVAAAGGGKLIDLDADNMPVGEVIKYICDQLGLKYKVEEYAVIIGDDAKFQELETKFYSISAGLLEIVENKASSGIDGGGGGGGLGLGLDAGAGGGGGPDFQGYFSNLGITFPPGAKIKFVQQAMRLVVTNTPENQDKLSNVLQNIGIETPQVSVESKFIEINDTDVEELGVSWNIGRPNHIIRPNGIDHQTLLNDTNSIGQTNVSFYDGNTINNPNLGKTSLSSGIRALSTLTGASPAVQAGVNLIFSDFVFQGLIRALEQQSSGDVLSAPQVTAVSGKTAVIRVVQERYFPESWDQPDISTEFVFGSSPQFGEARDIGIVFEVTPQVEPDGYTISLDLKPQVLAFVRYDTAFNSTINLPATFGGGTIPVIYSMPILSARTIETRVTIWDGETIMLGGLVTDNVVSINDRVPYLSDIPFIGRMFQNKGEQSTKQNLLVFVTARLIDPSGLPKKPKLNRGLPDFKRL